MNMYERYKKKKLPPPYQEKAEAFANAPVYEISSEEKLFRAAFWIGIKSEKIMKEIEVENVEK